jgi:Ca-activated chloride channel family protein
MNDILDGNSQPTVWSPGDQSWVDQINQTWQEHPGRPPLISETCAPTVYDPIGFAMWRPMAEAMGWPDQAIGWDSLVALAADPQGWAAYGHPEWGQFKFGHTLPGSSNSGLLILTALAYDKLGLTRGLTPDLVKSEAVISAMREVERHTIVYGEKSEDLLALMARREHLTCAVNTNEAGGPRRMPIRKLAAVPVRCLSFSAWHNLGGPSVLHSGCRMGHPRQRTRAAALRRLSPCARATSPGG